MEREYIEDLIISEMRKVKFSNSRLIRNDENHNVKGIPLIVLYYPLLKPLSAIDRYISILYMDKM